MFVFISLLACLSWDWALEEREEDFEGIGLER
jgi:hypothetical protein